MIMTKTAKNGWDLITRAAAQAIPGAMKIPCTDGCVMVFGKDAFKKDGTLKKEIAKTLKMMREEGLLAVY